MNEREQKEWDELFTLFDDADMVFIRKNKSKGFWLYLEKHKNPKIQAWMHKRLDRILTETAMRLAAA